MYTCKVSEEVYIFFFNAKASTIFLHVAGHREDNILFRVCVQSLCLQDLVMIVRGQQEMERMISLAYRSLRRLFHFGKYMEIEILPHNIPGKDLVEIE